MVSRVLNLDKGKIETNLDLPKEKGKGKSKGKDKFNPYTYLGDKGIPFLWNRDIDRVKNMN